LEEIKIIFLAIIQGITEFLPISSSGHIVLFENIFGSTDSNIILEVILHFGTLISILIFFRKDIFKVVNGALRGEKDSISYGLQVIIATMPVVIFILLTIILDFQIESLFVLKTLMFTYLANSVILYITKGSRGVKNNITYFLAIVMGISQVFALLPGISRAGITICTALFFGFNQKSAAKFSFFMAIPAILGALIFKIEDIYTQSSIEVHALVLGFLFSMITGLFVLKLLFRILENQKLWMFSFYSMLIWLTATLIYV
jgi:undecaprenyl-diphosphatase